MSSIKAGLFGSIMAAMWLERRGWLGWVVAAGVGVRTFGFCVVSIVVSTFGYVALLSLPPLGLT